MFKKQSQKELESLLDYLEAFAISQIKSNLMCESNFDGDVLEFEIQNKNTNQTYNFVINGHEASQKIWYSSPVSKPKYYVFNTNNNGWIESTTQTNIATDLQADLAIIIQDTK